MLLQDKVAVIYGAGAVGAAVARAFAGEGATVFVTGRRLALVEVVAKEIVAGGGIAHPAEVDALDEPAVAAHLQSVVERAGRIDVSFNAVGLPNAEVLGVPFVEMDAARFARPIAAYPMSYFLTARLAARHMIPNRSGVIMTVTALPARMGSPLNGGYGPAQAAKEALTRDLSFELAPQGIRVVGLRPYGIADTATVSDLFELKAKASGMTWEQFEQFLVARTHPHRLSTVDELANMAVFAASDKGSGLTGTNINLGLGSVDD